MWINVTPSQISAAGVANPSNEPTSSPLMPSVDAPMQAKTNTEMTIKIRSLSQYVRKSVIPIAPRQDKNMMLLVSVFTDVQIGRTFVSSNLRRDDLLDVRLGALR